jgi:NAD dependent epimerase/dehydratase family enzyme
MAAAAGTPLRFPVPALVLKAVLGEMSIEVLKSFTVSAKKIMDTGFRFQYPQVQQAVLQLNKKAS